MMKRLILLCVATALLLCGCGGKSSVSAVADATSAASSAAAAAAPTAAPTAASSTGEVAGTPIVRVDSFTPTGNWVMYYNELVELDPATSTLYNTIFLDDPEENRSSASYSYDAAAMSLSISDAGTIYFDPGVNGVYRISRVEDSSGNPINTGGYWVGEEDMTLESGGKWVWVMGDSGIVLAFDDDPPTAYGSGGTRESINILSSSSFSIDRLPCERVHNVEIFNGIAIAAEQMPENGSSFSSYVIFPYDGSLPTATPAAAPLDQA